MTARRAVVVLAVVLAAAAGPRAEEVAAQLAERAGQREPRLRIGLSDAHALEIDSTRGLRIVDAERGRQVWRPRYEGPVRVVAEGGPVGEVEQVFRIQAGAYSSAEAARRELERLREATGAPGIVRHDPDRGTWRVRVGEASERLALNSLMDRLRALGLKELWIAAEAAERAEGVQLRLVDASWESFPTERTRLLALPEPGSRLRVDGKAYRGIVELRVTDFGTVRAINWINLEQYLLGVVPAELGPEVWPQLEALKAQAVAARTYAWRNRGQFLDEGYDLCDTPRCQVYAGADGEHPLSDRAVNETAGQVLAWQGEPIVALYTATCGGHTENGGEIFAEHAEPYLQGVPCRAESDALATLRATIEGRALEPLRDETGRDVTREWALLAAAGVVSSRPPASIDGPRLREWTRALARRSGREVPQGEAPAADTLAGAAAMLLADLGWDARAEVLLDGEDLSPLLRDVAVELLPDGERRALAYLASVEALRPFPDGSIGARRAADGARLLPALVEIGRTYRAFGLRQATVSGMGKDSLRMFQRKNEIRLPFARRPYLFASTGGTATAVARLEIWPGDEVRFRTNGAGEIDFLEILPLQLGASDDRSSRVYSWSVRKSRNELEAGINRRVAVGRVRDLQVVRRGVSGRVVELRVVGTDATEVVRGFSVRNLLDLREILAVLEIQRDARGEIEAVVFAGKGWGHGVGLCQVGAYGMAVRGASYREILAHYYRGTRLLPLAQGGR